MFLALLSLISLIRRLLGLRPSLNLSPLGDLAVLLPSPNFAAWSKDLGCPLLVWLLPRQYLLELFDLRMDLLVNADCVLINVLQI